MKGIELTLCCTVVSEGYQADMLDSSFRLLVELSQRGNFWLRIEYLESYENFGTLKVSCPVFKG